MYFLLLVKVFYAGHFSNDIHHPFRGSHIETASDIGGIVLALYSVLWAYEGWLVYI